VNPIVIVGTGLAGYTLARELRKRDPDVPLHLVTTDGGESYSKPMLSNGMGKEKTPDQLVMATAEKMAADLKAEIWTHTQVDTVLPEQRRLETRRGELAYDRLVLAVGADPIRLTLEGDAADEVLSVNDLDDYRRFREAIAGGGRVAILGAGLIGCEFADDLHRGGIGAEIIDPTPWPLGRLLPPRAAATLRRSLEQAGIRFHCGAAATRMERQGNAYRLSLSDGGVVDADAVLSAVGLRPRTQLAQTAGLDVERGIVVDRQLQTSADGIYALGDCAEVAGLVLPFVMPLMTAARALAATLSGTPTPVVYPAMPVVVKTPDCPVVVSPPPADASGEWHEEVIDGGVRALFRSADDRLLGFALVGSAASEKQALTKQLPPWLG